MSISDAEREVIEILWEKSPLTADDIIEQVADKQDWGAATVKTLLNRLLKKSAIAAEKDGRRYLYRPVLERSDYVESQSQGLLDKLFEGRVGPLVTYFSKQDKLTSEDVEDLKRLIADLEDGENNDGK
jgi:predicted transcriptional regulator